MPLLLAKSLRELQLGLLQRMMVKLKVGVMMISDLMMKMGVMSSKMPRMMVLKEMVGQLRTI